MHLPVTRTPSPHSTPHAQGADFVRGYPFTLREGVPTAVSHGLWLNIPDYDAPTQVPLQVQCLRLMLTCCCCCC